MIIREPQTIDDLGTVAVVGLSCRFPGAADADEFWRNLRGGVESISFFSDEELVASGNDPTQVADPDYVPARGFLEDADRFDAPFFGMSPREAALTDPQHRVFLECAWSALENAGYDPETYAGLIGVYAGVGLNTYLLNNLVSSGLVESVPGTQAAVGNDKDHLPTYVSYKLDLKGPSVCVQTACSTSLVAVHLGCQALLSGECDMALAGGVSIAVPLKAGYTWQEGGILSPDGHCRAFDARAGGTVGGNGAGIVVLKRLVDAVADGDSIRAVIKGSAINNDGSLKIGYTAPSVEGQAAVIAMAQAVAEVEPESISYVEAHGTGTRLGDPIEITALTQAFRRGTDACGFCAIGSVKTNLGHLDAAAGVAGLIKTVLALQHRELPPSLHYESPNPEIDFAETPFFVNDSLAPWEADGGPRRAGVSSLGIGGTNAHVILEEAPEEAEAAGRARPWQLVVLSARSDKALEAATTNLADHLDTHADLALPDVAYTLQVGRKEFDHRRAVVCRDLEDARSALESREPSRVFTAKADGELPVMFMFPGQGAQHVNMGEGLHESEPVFREAVDRCSELLEPHLGLRLEEVLYPVGEDDAASDRLEQTSMAQPALFTIEYALARLWMSWGVSPRAMIGHSIGEYVAACLSGVLSLEDALELVAARGRLMQSVAEGSMLAVSLSVDELEPRLEGKVEIAVVNEPSRCVVSGTEDAIAELEERLANEGLGVRRLHTSHAFHSSMMDPILEPFSVAVEKVDLEPPRIPYISNVTGTWITDEEATDVNYWVRHLRRTVFFESGLRELFGLERGVLLEVGPGKTLGRASNRHPERPPGIAVLSSMRHPRENQDDAGALLEALGKLWLSGGRIEWASFHQTDGGRRVPLPGYPFERERYWIESKERPRTSRGSPEDLGKTSRVADWFYVPSWRRGVVGSGTGAATDADRRWLVFSDGNGVGERITERLRRHDRQVVMVSSGERFARIDANTYEIDPGNRRDYVALIDSCVLDQNVPQRIVHLWGSDRIAANQGRSASLEDGLDRGFYSLLYLVQALDEQGVSDPLHLTVATTGVLDVVGDEDLRPEIATVLGACKVIPQEYSNISCESLDFPVSGFPVSGSGGRDGVRADQLLAELLAPRPGAVVALRGEHRWIQTFEPVQLDDETTGPSPHLREGGVYVVVGGLGGIGFESADFLARTERVKLVLVGRTKLPATDAWDQWLMDRGDEDDTSQKIRRVRALEELGAQVLTVEADVTDRESFEAAIRTAEERCGRIRGVIYAVGAEKSTHMIQSSSRAEWDRQLVPKLRGLPVLEATFEGKELDFCLLQSSLSSILGAVGFAAYAAAHTFMDAYARAHNRNAALPWTCVNWDNWLNWKEPRPIAGSNRPDFFMTREEAREALRRVLANKDLKDLVVSTGDLRARVERWITSTSSEDDAVESELDEAASVHERPEIAGAYVAPSTDVEQTLARIWGEALGIARVGVNDNFFDLGGDSVLGISIASRARKAGIQLNPEQLFEHQTVAELATVCASVDGGELVVEQRPASGPVPLTPIQHWFFEQGLSEPHHFNLSVLLEPRQKLDPASLELAVRHVLRAHDSMRLRYVQGEDGIDQRYGDEVEEVPFTTMDLSALPVSERAAAMHEAFATLQASLDLSEGPLLRFALFEMGVEKPQRLLGVAHHLLVDVFSWKTLTEDLESAYRQVRQGAEVRLPLKTTSFKEWSERLCREAGAGSFLGELDHWRSLTGVAAPRLPVDAGGGPNSVASARSLSVSLSAEDTDSLLRDVPRAFNAQPQEVLLAALVQAFARWTGEPMLLIELEGHAREAGLGAIDLSRTIGWFTTTFPVLLVSEKGAEPAEALKSIKEQVRRVPRQGLGYGVLRYLTDDPEVASAMRALPEPEVSFLYLGGLTEVPTDSSLFAYSDEPTGPACGAGEARSHLLQIAARISDGRLSVKWVYSENIHRRETVEAVADGLVEYLQALIRGCRSSAGIGQGYTPSDFPGVDMDQEELDEFLQRIVRTGEDPST